MDKNYWIEYYKKNLAPHEPSQFALDMRERLEKGKSLFELGCGNGRDSIFFGKNGLNVTAIDQAQNAIEELNQKYEYIEFLVDDFVESLLYKQREFDYVYSRFTLHAITKSEQNKVFNNAYHCLKNDGQLLIEVRSTKDLIYGLGQKVGEHEYIYENHYRRFVDKAELEEELTTTGFKIIMSEEDKGFAPIRDQDPILLRIVAQK
ncbi:MAG: Methylase involved in ubiquinone/menaquinone biosynthesis [Neobacillus sp.]|nr:Methylase involved in ubiquinone/menaquinone biosynthesis [Neobacillus sp.]